MRYAIVLEKAGNNFSAYVPDLPGCVATGQSLAETETEIRSAISFHLQGMLEDGLQLPQPASSVEYLEIDVSAMQAAFTHTQPLNHHA